MTSNFNQTQEELIEELSKDPEAKLILQELLRKEFDVSKYRKDIMKIIIIFLIYQNYDKILH